MSKAEKQQALDMPDGLRAPFYTITYRYGQKIVHDDWDTLEEALSYLLSGEDYGEHSTDECGDSDGWLWRRSRSFAAPFEAAERAPKRPAYYFYCDD